MTALMKLATEIEPGKTTGHDIAHHQLNDWYNQHHVLHVGDDVQVAIDAAESAGGSCLHFLPGVYTLTTPLVLPRTNQYGAGGVQLVGAGIGITELKAAADFPLNQPLLRWSDSPGMAYYQRISDLTLNLNNRAQRAIHYAPAGDKTTWEVTNGQRLRITLKRLHILSSNDVHEDLIRLEGTISNSLVEWIYNDPLAGNRTYDTLLLSVDSAADYGEIAELSSDLCGIGYSTVCHLYSNFTRGGNSRVFSGRMVNSVFEHAFCDGGHTGSNFDFRDCANTTLTHLATEGRNEKPQYRFDNCEYMTVNHIGIGTPDDYYGTGLGNGLELINCRDNEFNGRWCNAGKPAFSSKGVKVITIDTDCKRNTFKRWGIKSGGMPADEFTISGDSSNTIDYMDFATNTSGTITGGS